MNAPEIVTHWLSLAAARYRVKDGWDLLIVLEALEQALRRRRSIGIPEAYLAGGARLLIQQSYPCDFRLPCCVPEAVTRLGESLDAVEAATEALVLAAKASFLWYLSDRASSGDLVGQATQGQKLTFANPDVHATLLQAIQAQAWRRGQWCTYEYRIERYGPPPTGGRESRAQWFGNWELDLVDILAEAIPEAFAAWERILGYSLGDLRQVVGELHLIQLERRSAPPVVSLCVAPAALGVAPLATAAKDLALSPADLGAFRGFPYLVNFDGELVALPEWRDIDDASFQVLRFWRHHHTQEYDSRIGNRFGEIARWFADYWSRRCPDLRFRTNVSQKGLPDMDLVVWDPCDGDSLVAELKSAAVAPYDASFEKDFIERHARKAVDQISNLRTYFTSSGTHPAEVAFRGEAGLRNPSSLWLAISSESTGGMNQTVVPFVPWRLFWMVFSRSQCSLQFVNEVTTFLYGEMERYLRPITSRFSGPGTSTSDSLIVVEYNGAEVALPPGLGIGERAAAFVRAFWQPHPLSPSTTDPPEAAGGPMAAPEAKDG